MRPRLLDLFCGAGGCTKGYQRAGFYVVGVDIEPQPNYCGDEFIQVHAEDQLRWIVNGARLDGYGRLMLGDYAAFHASPPCQNDTSYRRRAGHVRLVPRLIEPIRDLLRVTELPYVIENVSGAPLEAPAMLCGSSFGLDVRRHRLFETNWPLLVPPCNHSWQTPRFPAATNREPNSRRTVEVGVWRIPLEVQRRAMGIDWMTLAELSQAIPPAYTEHIGHQLMQHIRAGEKAA